MLCKLAGPICDIVDEVFGYFKKHLLHLRVNSFPRGDLVNNLLDLALCKHPALVCHSSCLLLLA